MSSLTRKFLSELGLNDETSDLIIKEHTGVTDALKADSQKNADKIADLQKQLDDSKKEIAVYADKLSNANAKISEFEREDFKSKYDSKVQELENLKSDYAAKESATNRKNVLSKKLKNLGYSDSATSIIVNRSDFPDKIQLDENGNATNIDDVITGIQNESDFAGFTPHKDNSAHMPSNPPGNNGKSNSMTKEKIMSIKNTAERQKAISENPELFGLD